MKKSFFFFLLLLTSLFCFAENIQGNLLYNLKASGENIESEQLAKFPYTVKCNINKRKNTGITISADFDIPKETNEDIGLILYKNLLSCKVYVNDHLIDTLGRSGENFFFQPYISRGVIIPRSILKDKNTLRLECWNDTGDYSIRLLEFANKATYERKMRIYTFLDIQIPRFACVLLLFVTMYSLFMFFNYKNKKDFFYLALSSLFFAGYMINVTVYDSSMNYLLLKAILYSLFPMAVLFLIQYFNKFCNIKAKKEFLLTINIIGLVFIIGYFFQKDTVALDTWHSIMLIYPFFGLGYGIYGVIKSRKEKIIRNLGVGIGIFIAIIFSLYDMYNFIFHITPFILLQGPGFMALTIGTFYSLSQDLATTNKQCVRFAKELNENQDRQIIILSHVRGVSEKITDSGKNLENSIESISALVTQYITNVNQVHTSIQSQYEQVKNNKENISRIFIAIDKMSQMVNTHEKLVEDTVSDISELTDGINKTDELIKKSSETIEALTNICSEADRDVLESSNLVDDLASYSKNIYTIVNSISEISEQTNVLSINAAIEAARSGDAGKGFKVVAGEIRALATESTKNTTEITKILSTMISKIENIQHQEELVSSRLKKVISENAKTQNEMSDIYGLLKFQLEKSSRISSIITDLVDTVHNISEQTAEQQNSGESLNESLSLLTKITNSVFDASKEQQDCNIELKEHLKNIKSVSNENVNITNELTQILE